MGNTIQFNKCELSLKLLILLLGLASAFKYRLDLENEDVFSDCPNQPSNVKGIREFFDFSELQTRQDGNKIMVSGNLTSMWDYDPTDRIEGTITVFRYERREWMNTLISISFEDICSDLYNEEKHFYKFWTKHVVNVKDLKDKCFLNGTKFIHEEFVVDTRMDTLVPAGQHKAVVKIMSFDKNKKIRDPIMCFEIEGDGKMIYK
ncbi:hypothetical protein KR044_008758 [Drosophila immigrans]|nr:hypothetical protein KR044_008758 [Drosophila immigrans]